MSYCRWSSDDYQCDIYCYEDVNGGYTTHIAAKKYDIKSELPPYVSIEYNSPESIELWYKRSREVDRIIHSSDLVKIDLPYTGESFNDPDAKSTAERLIMLRELGYRVPQYAIDALLEESKNETIS